MSMKKRKYGIVIFMAVLVVSSFGIPALAASGGTERYFYSAMPLTYANTYFQEQTKETDYNTGYVRYYDSEGDIWGDCTGFNAWFCDNGTERKTNIVYVKNLGTNYTVTYNKRYNKGATVRLGLEDYDYTSVFHHKVWGYVNYR